MATSKPKKKKPSALAAAATRKLQKLTSSTLPFSTDQFVHAMMHAEEAGDAIRVPQDDGRWAWQMTLPDGQTQTMRPTNEMLAVLHRFETEGHPAHDDEERG